MVFKCTKGILPMATFSCPFLQSLLENLQKNSGKPDPVVERWLKGMEKESTPGILVATAREVTGSLERMSKPTAANCQASGLAASGR